jgi:hypothetical protein
MKSSASSFAAHLVDEENQFVTANEEDLHIEGIFQIRDFQ